jgi:hypothetical protein
LKDKAFKQSVGNTLNEVQKLEQDGIVNISLSGMKCLELFLRELPADVAKMKADIEVLTNTSSSQENEIKQLKSGIKDIWLSIENANKRMSTEKNTNNKMQQQLNSTLLVALKEDVSELENGFEARLTILEGNQGRLESRQERVEQNLNEFLKMNSNVKQGSLKNCLPDCQEKVFGREAEIEHVVGLIQQDKMPCVVLTGGPGFGKTAVAINLAHKLKASKVIIFVSLRDIHSIKDICSALLARVGQYPKEKELEELVQWARSLNDEVVLILDNAEDALQSDIKDAFCDLLQDLRSTNSPLLQFLITSRERFSMSAMEVTIQEIKELDTEEGIKVIRSMAPGSDNSGDSDAFTKLASLCGGIPLALRMIGSLLHHVDNVTSLIDELQSIPMETLEDKTLPPYHQSIRAAFECSFKRLDPTLQAKLLRLAVFRGSFTQEAASAILEKRSVAAGQILKELTDKSLLCKLDPMKRYEMHSLFQKYLIDRKKDKYSNNFDAATNNFIDYYVKVTMDGHRMFWSKDEFKHSIEMFRNENLNIEIALRMCYTDAKKMEKFFPYVWSVSMYLEMCISFEKLNTFLESCRTSAANQKEKGTEMEALCFIGYYEWKKAGNSENYKTLINDAKSLYDKEEKSFSESQKWLYKHSYGMFLDQQRMSDEALEVTLDAMEIAEKNLNSTDLSLTLSQLGIIEKHREDFSKAELWMTKSHNRRKETLGEDHVLSISKHLADLYLQQDKNKKALELYEEGLNTYKTNDMDNEKQCIYLLKNMGSCCFKLEKVEESLEYFHKALGLSERRLEGDQTVKVLLYSEMANVHISNQETKSVALDYARKALQMADRLQMTQWFSRQQMEDIVKGSVETEKCE